MEEQPAAVQPGAGMHGPHIWTSEMHDAYTVEVLGRPAQGNRLNFAAMRPERQRVHRQTHRSTGGRRLNARLPPPTIPPPGSLNPRLFTSPVAQRMMRMINNLEPIVAARLQPAERHMHGGGRSRRNEAGNTLYAYNPDDEPDGLSLADVSASEASVASTLEKQAGIISFDLADDLSQRLQVCDESQDAFSGFMDCDVEHVESV